MPVIKRSVSFRPEIWAEVERVTRAESGPVSNLINEALVHYLRIKRGLEAVAEWEAEHGAITEDEMAAAERTLRDAGALPG